MSYKCTKSDEDQDTFALMLPECWTSPNTPTHSKQTVSPINQNKIQPRTQQTNSHLTQNKQTVCLTHNKQTVSPTHNNKKQSALHTTKNRHTYTTQTNSALNTTNKQSRLHTKKNSKPYKTTNKQSVHWGNGCCLLQSFELENLECTWPNKRKRNRILTW